MTSEKLMGVLGILLFSSLAWAAVGDVPPLPPQDSAAHHYQLDVASQPASLEPVGRATRRLMQAPASCQFAPDAEPWCSEIPPHLCDEASELGLVFRSHCATTCQICKAEASAQDKLLERGQTVEFRTGHLVIENSVSENGWNLWLEKSGALTEGFPVGNGRVRVNHTTIYVPATPDCDAYYLAARRLIDEYKIQAAHIDHHNCKTNLSMTYHEAGIVHLIQSGTPLVHEGGLYANKHAWYVHLDSNEYPRLFLMNMANKGHRKVAVVWWSGHDWASASAQYVTENYMSPYGLELVYKYSWAPEDGGGKASGVTDDRTYQEIYNTTLWDQMLQEISDSGAEVLVMYCIAEGVSIMKRIKALNLNFKGVFMTVSPSRPFWEEYLDIDGDLVITPSQWHPDIQSPCSVFGDAQNYGLEYEKRFGVPASYDVASRSAAGLMLQHAIQTFNSIENVISGLQIMSVDTMFGHVKFSLSQRNIGRNPVGMQRQNTELELVLPEELAMSSAIDMISWACRSLLYDSDQDVCSDEELEIYEQCRADHPALVNSACEEAVLAQGANQGVGRTAIVGTAVAVAVVVAVVLALFVRSRYLTALKFKIAFDELKFVEFDGEYDRRGSYDGGDLFGTGNSSQGEMAGITWRGYKVVLLRSRQAGEEISTVLKRTSSMAVKKVSRPLFGTSRCCSVHPGAVVAPEQAALRSGQAQKTSLPFDPPSLGALRHPNLVNVLGTTFSPVGDIHYVVVEAMPVGNMHEFLQHDLANVMTGAASFSAALGIVTGLQYLHESRPAIVHGDLRAEHVLLDEKLSAKVRIETHVTAQSQTGTPTTSQKRIDLSADTGSPAARPSHTATAWMAPELLTGGSVTTSSDIYALGVTLWEILTKETPYESLGVTSPKHLPPDTVAAILNQQLRPAIPADMPKAVRGLLERCWDKDPSRRPCIDEVADVLSAEQSSTPVAVAHTNTQQSRNLLYQMLPPHVATALEQGRKVEPEDFPNVTIFFSDIVGYTDMSSTMPPQKVMDMLDRLYARFDELTKKHGLFKVETIGDAYMCVGGLPKAQQDHTLRIARFALEAVQAANQVMVDEEAPEKGSISIRVGFHSGPVVASVVGNLNPRYCLFGDTVNMASRMESNSEANKINLSPRAQKLLVIQCDQEGGTAHFNQRGLIQIKGKGATECFFLESIDTPAGLVGDEVYSFSSA